MIVRLQLPSLYASLGSVLVRGGGAVGNGGEFCRLRVSTSVKTVAIARSSWKPRSAITLPGDPVG